MKQLNMPSNNKLVFILIIIIIIIMTVVIIFNLKCTHIGNNLLEKCEIEAKNTFEYPKCEFDHEGANLNLKSYPCICWNEFETDNGAIIKSKEQIKISIIT